MDGNLGLNYGKFDIFEGNYDSEVEEEDDYSDRSDSF